MFKFSTIFNYIIKSSLLILLTFQSVSGNSQNRITDSLEKILKYSKEDSTKVNLLDNLSWEYVRTDINKAIHYAKEQLSLAEKINFKKGQATAHFNLAAINYMQSNYTEAIKNFKISFKLKKSYNDLTGAAGVLNNIAMSNQQLGNYPDAVQNYIEAIKIFEQQKDENRLASSCNNITALYVELKNYKEALKFGLRSLKIYEHLGDKSAITGVLINLGNIYNQQHMNDKALLYYKKAEENEKVNQNKYYQSRTFNNIGAIYLEEKKYIEAKDYLDRSVKLKEELNDKEGLTSAYYSLGSLYTKTGKINKAIEFHKKAVALSREIGYTDGVKWGYLGLKEAYAANNNLAEALNYYTLYEQVKDTLYNEDNNKKIAEMQTKYETEKKEKENYELKYKSELQKIEIQEENKKRKNQLLFAIASSLFIIGMIVIFHNRKKLKQKALHATQMAEAEKERFKDVIDAEEKERSRIAKELHDGLGQLLSTARLNVAGLEESVIEEDKAVLEKSLQIIDNACIEVRNISHNMMPSALMRLGLIPAIKEVVENINSSKKIKIDFETNLNSTLGQSLDITIYRIIQEVLNNMIKHSEADLIELSIKNNNGKLFIAIKDNGIGFDTNQLKDSKGMGWKNIFSRVSMINGTIELNSETKKGTIVMIELELKNE